MENEIKCDLCGKKGASLYHGQYLCRACLEAELRRMNEKQQAAPDEDK